MRRFIRQLTVTLFLVLAGGSAAAEPFEIDLNKGRLLRLS